MQLKFIVDTQLPPSLIKIFQKHKIDAIHTTYFPDGHLLNDVQIIKIAFEQNRIIITKDSDFFEYFLLRGAPPKILFLEIGNIKNAELFRLIDEKIPSVRDFYLHQKAEFILLDKNKIAVY